MSSGCGDVLSLEDLRTAKKHQLFEAEVITGKQGGVSSGADIDYATNQATGQVQKTLPAVLRGAGFTNADFTFATGGTLGVGDQDKAVMWPAPAGNGLYYAWHGALPKVVPAGSSPETTGGVSDTAWKLVGDLGLRADLASPTGYQLIPSVQLQVWRNVGDVRGWLAVCDGVADDADAIMAAAAARQGNITIPGPCFVSKTIYIRGYDNPTISFIGNGSLKTSTSFSFRPGTRGIITLHECSSPTVINPVITGSRVTNTAAAEPWQDGDAGVEYLVCTGTCKTQGGRLRNFKTWGVIHTQCEEYDVESTIISDCMVQSGIGGISVQKARIANVAIDKVGLYGIELESRDAIDTTMVSNVLVTNSQKGVMAYDSIIRPSITGVTVKNCLEGISQSNTTGNSGEGGSVTACNLIDCVTAFTLNNINKTRISGNTARTFLPEIYTRTRALDFIFRMTSATAYVVDHDDTPALLTVGETIKLDDGVVRTIDSITAQTTDPLFGKIRGFTTTPAMSSTSERSAIFRKRVPGKTAVVMYDGVANTISGNVFGLFDTGLLSFRNHDLLTFSRNIFEDVTKILENGQDGSITNSKIGILPSEVTGVTPAVISTHGKFPPAFAEASHWWVSHAAFNKIHTVACGGGVVGKIVCILDNTVSSTGAPVLKVNGVDTISSFTGSPQVGVANVNLPVQGSISFQLTDTAGDLIGDGFSIKILGAYHTP